MLRLLRKIALGDGFGDHFLRVVPECGGTFGDVPIACEDAVARDPVAFPRAAFADEIEQHGLQAVEGVGELGFRRLAHFKFVPEGAEFGSLVGGEQGEYAVGGASLAFVLVGHAGGVVGESIADIYLDEIVKEHHFQNAEEVDVRHVAVLGENDDEEREVP